MGGNLLSAVMIIKDEENVIERCLGSIADIADELIIVDTGSTDSTLDLVKKYDSKLFEYEWHNDFSQARNYGLDRASGKWILHIDADEEFVPGDKDELFNLLMQDDIDVINVSMIDSANKNIWQYPRIFRNYPLFRYENEIHEEIPFSLKSDLNDSYSKARIIHYGYEADIVYSKDKNKRNIEILKNSIKRDKNSVNALYHYGVELKNFGDLEKSITYLKLAIDQRHDLYSALAFKLVAENYSLMGRTEEAIDTLNAGIRIYPDFTDLRFLAGINYLKLNLAKKALGYFVDCLQKGPPSLAFPQIPEVGGVLPLLFYGFSLHSMGERKKADKVFADAIAALRNNADALSYLSKIFIRLHGNEKAREMMMKMANLENPLVKKIVSINFP